MNDMSLRARAAAVPLSCAPARSRVILLTLCLGMLVAQIDTSVVNLAIQPIGAALHAPVSALQWVLDAYNLTYTVLLLTGGLIADRHGRKLAFCLGAGVMAAGQLACVLAPAVGWLVAARAMTGLGAALLLPASLAIIRVVWTEPVARGRALGVWASCNGLAFAIGPTLGGLLVAHFGWRSVFVLVLPVALAAVMLALLAVPDSADPRRRPLDPPGQALGMLALGGLVYGVIAGSGPAFAVAAVAGAAFLLAEHRAGDGAMMPLAMFRRAPFSGALVATTTMTFGIYGMIFLLPLEWLESGQLTVAGAGLGMLPPALAFFLVSQRSGHLAERVGRRTMTAGGTALIGCGLLLAASAWDGMPLWWVEIGLAMAGVGMGLNTGPLMGVAVEAVSPARSGTAAALFNVARMTGATLGIAVLGSVFAASGGGPEGLRLALMLGGAAQLAGGAVAWVTIRR
jgi:MFS family permease